MPNELLLGLPVIAYLVGCYAAYILGVSHGTRASEARSRKLIETQEKLIEALKEGMAIRDQVIEEFLGQGDRAA